MSEEKKKTEPRTADDVGVVFISPIVGLPPSLLAAFDGLRAMGAEVEGVDIFEGQAVKKSFWKLLGLTFLPGADARRITFANSYDERKLFEIIAGKAEALASRGKRKIILGGMSGGFIYASRMAQHPADAEIAPYAARVRPLVRGIFGVSPLIFYPAEVMPPQARIEAVPADISLSLVWGDDDTIIPAGTIAYGERVAKDRANVRCRVIKGSEAGVKDGSVRHQFFGGRDFAGFLSNVFWNSAAEKIALEEITHLVTAA